MNIRSKGSNQKLTNSKIFQLTLILQKINYNISLHHCQNIDINDFFSFGLIYKGNHS